MDYNLLRNTDQPHEFLGMHEQYKKGVEIVVVRVFCPDAIKVVAKPKTEPDKEYALQELSEGLFEGVMGKHKKKFPYILRYTNQSGETWESEDAYAFEPYISQDNLKTFLTSIDPKAYSWMGAHVTTKESVRGVNFTVWAPNAKRVSIIGEFNNWDGRRHIMTNYKYSGIFNIFIPGISEHSCYKYEIKTQDDSLLYKADPYARRFALRPETYCFPYNGNSYTWKNEGIDKQDINSVNKPVNIYEVHIGSWRRKGNNEFLTYREIAQPLAEYVNEMNYTHVELMGIMEHPFDGSWGYQVTGYFAPTTRYGMPDDFKYLMDVLHQHGIGVILDWVPGHFPKDAFGFEYFDGTHLYEKPETHPDWGTLLFDYYKREVKSFLISSAMMWFDEYKADGIRVDAVASMLFGGRLGSHESDGTAVEFLKELNQTVKKEFPHKIVIAEDSSAWYGVTKKVDEGGLGFDYKWNLGWMNDVLKYMSYKFEHRGYIHDKLTFSLSYMYNENYILPLSHDEVVHGKSPMLYKMSGDWWQRQANLRLLYGYMYVHPGKKLMFMGNEFVQTSEWYEGKSLDWHLLEYKDHRETLLYVKELNELYKSHPALYEEKDLTQNFSWIRGDDLDTLIVSFIRRTKKEELIIILNFSIRTHLGYIVGAEKEGTYKEIFNSDKLEYGGTGRLNGELQTNNFGYNYKEFSLYVDVPPAGLVVLKHIK
ncbi:hypothetical protein AN639_06905 [Candidatus Epulonipiscium fishelsonii]|uniref:Uncharacterized protein n=1 Tax=Candidatus Epulonipiscium fishelsonii TaxID=77094 RepID=A0ACC8XBF5_9FIRM|nr:hypothetical protein AN639_06905 [Epulopiscium sp. SCG-B05WGA-EpuloA1]ONI39662.1 hypothetical protein AN396_07855 [Epulopiscium sp. SCG-B11WGA-EpuloA1]ONI47511.1 hypothetical protein AN644_05020 [Epulopiscium sp. SCG-C06WGA-EpuloA1]